jgi:hypothetical protein
MGNQVRDEQAEWDARVVALSLRQVQQAYRDHNAALFSDRLKTPVIRFAEGKERWGAWSSSDRVLELALRLLDRPWGDLLEVLKHEMAHQYVDEVLGKASDEGPHGPTFVAVCAERGIDARTAFDPESAWIEGEAERDQQGILRRIRHLFSLAQSDNPHEAEAAMRAAQRLMLKYNLDATLKDAAAGYAYRHLGRPTGRRMAWQRVLGSILAEFFFVEVIVVPVYRAREGKKGSVLEACGTRQNLEIAAYVHDFLENTAVQLWAQHQRKLRVKGQSEKNSFMYGVMRGFLDKLTLERQRSAREGLVYVGDAGLRQYLRARHPYIRSVSGSGQVGRDAFSAGHAAGGRIVLHRGVESGSSAGQVRQLGSRARS